MQRCSSAMDMNGILTEKKRNFGQDGQTVSSTYPVRNYTNIDAFFFFDLTDTPPASESWVQISKVFLRKHLLHTTE